MKQTDYICKKKGNKNMGAKKKSILTANDISNICGISIISLYHLSFCGYFPSEDPQYSIIVSLNKKGLPASGGGMAGPVFRQTVEFICDCKSK